MNSKSDPEFARQLLETDREVHIDAPRLTSQLVARRQAIRRTRRIRQAGALITVIAGVLILSIVGPKFFVRESEPRLAQTTSPEAKPDQSELKASLQPESAAKLMELRSEFEAMAEYRRRLVALKTQVAGLREQRQQRQLFVLKENLSRTLFDENFETIFSKY